MKSLLRTRRTIPGAERDDDSAQRRVVVTKSLNSHQRKRMPDYYNPEPVFFVKSTEILKSSIDAIMTGAADTVEGPNLSGSSGRTDKDRKARNFSVFYDKFFDYMKTCKMEPQHPLATATSLEALAIESEHGLFGGEMSQRMSFLAKLVKLCLCIAEKFAARDASRGGRKETKEAEQALRDAAVFALQHTESGVVSSQHWHHIGRALVQAVADCDSTCRGAVLATWQNAYSVFIKQAFTLALQREEQHASRQERARSRLVKKHLRETQEASRTLSMRSKHLKAMEEKRRQAQLELERERKIREFGERFAARKIWHCYCAYRSRRENWASTVLSCAWRGKIGRRKAALRRGEIEAEQAAQAEGSTLTAPRKGHKRGSSASIMYTAQALFDFEGDDGGVADNKRRLSMHVGDILQVRRVMPNGWSWVVDVASGSEGWVPSSYLRDVKYPNSPQTPLSATLPTSTSAGETKSAARRLSATHSTPTSSVKSLPFRRATSAASHRPLGVRTLTAEDIRSIQRCEASTTGDLPLMRAIANFDATNRGANELSLRRGVVYELLRTSGSGMSEQCLLRVYSAQSPSPQPAGWAPGHFIEPVTPQNVSTPPSAQRRAHRRAASSLSLSPTPNVSPQLTMRVSQPDDTPPSKPRRLSIGRKQRSATLRLQRATSGSKERPNNLRMSTPESAAPSKPRRHSVGRLTLSTPGAPASARSKLKLRLG